MNQKPLVKSLIIVLLLLSNVGCDQITKNAARVNLDYGRHVSVIDNLLWLVKVENKGAFLSAFNDLPEMLRIIFLIGLPMLVLLGFTGYLFYKKDLTKQTILALTFVIGGGFGNLIDRIRFGSVTDFLYMDFFLFHTGVFNMADVSIMLGMFILVIHTFTRKKNPHTSAGV